jgi:transcriptional accessory protein Tex/SPT6
MISNAFNWLTVCIVHYIIAEQISDNPKYRTKILKDMYHQGVLTTSKKKNAEDEKGIFEMYYAYSEPINIIMIDFLTCNEILY